MFDIWDEMLPRRSIIGLGSLESIAGMSVIVINLYINFNCLFTCLKICKGENNSKFNFKMWSS